MKKHSFLVRIAACLSAMVLAVSTTLAMTSFAEENTALNQAGGNTAVSEDAKGVFKIEVHYHPSQMEDMVVQTGTAFLINDSTLLTAAHVVTIDSTNKKAIAEYYTDKYNKKHTYDDDYVSFQLVVLSDNKEKVKISHISQQGDYAVLTLGTSLGGRQPLAIADSDAVQTTQQVYALGFPFYVSEELSNAKSTANTAKDVTITAGSVSKTGCIEKDTKSSARLIQHNAGLSAGNSGGPLVDTNGAVIGINNGGFDNFFYAIEINQITELLDAYKIEYTKADGTVAVTESSEIDASSEESVESSEVEVEVSSTPELSSLDTSDVAGTSDENSDNSLIIIIVIAAVVVVIIIVVIIILLKSNKKPKPPVGGNGVNGRGSAAIQNNGFRSASNGGFVPPTPPAPPYTNSGSTSTVSTGAGETSLLGDGAGETSVLSGNGHATLTRRKTGNKVAVKSPQFIIGKENNRVDYCINNNTVSRRHAKITDTNGTYYITDLGSSNYSYVNGKKLVPNVPEQLHDGDIIKLSDEEFEFRG
ncbi:MAG: trypsin-like peptidase domain-containing protein [Oscillospiraceae bacterium]